MIKKILRVGIIVGLISLVFWQTRGKLGNINELKFAFRQINLVWLSIIILGELGSYVWDGLLSKYLLQIAGKKLTFWQTFKIAIIDVFASQALPLGQTGAALTTAFLYKKLKVKNSSIAYLIGMWTTLTGIALGTLLLISWLTLPIRPHLNFNLNLIYLISVLILLIGSIYVFRLKQKLFFLFCVFCAFGYYLSLSVALWAGLQAFGISTSLNYAIFALLATQVVRVISLIPGGIGVVESSLTLILINLGLPASGVLASVLVYRTIDFWIPMLIGSIVIGRLTQEL